MIKFKVFEVMARQGFQTRKKLSEASGINASNLGRIIKGEIARIDVPTLDALCRALSCQPGDLLAYVPDEQAARPSKKSRK